MFKASFVAQGRSKRLVLGDKIQASLPLVNGPVTKALKIFGFIHVEDDKTEVSTYHSNN